MQAEWSFVANTTMTINVSTRVRWRRLAHLRAQANAALSREPKRTRQALFERLVRQMVEECVIVEIDRKSAVKDDSTSPATTDDRFLS